MGLIDRLKQALGKTPEVLPAIEEAPEEDLQWPEDLPQQILTVEEAALEIYRRHGLPTQRGGYRRETPDDEWQKLPDGLTPEEKWKLLDEAPAGSKWRFVTRAGLGRHSGIEEVRRASTLLQACDNLRGRLEGNEAVTPQDLADALNLGTASALLIQARQGGNSLEPSPDYKPLIFVRTEEDAAEKSTETAPANRTEAGR